jgi:hypothetical protein
MPTQHQVAAAAGLSEYQQVTAVSVANVPDDIFAAVIRSDAPPTVTTLLAVRAGRRLIGPNWNVKKSQEGRAAHPGSAEIVSKP